MRRIKLFVRESGGAVIEFAIVVPILLVILFGIIDFARMLLTRNSLVNAVREGARYGAVQPPTGWAATQTAIQGKVRGRIATFGGNATDASTATVTTSPAPGTGTSADYVVTVTVTGFPYRPLTPVLTMINRGAITMTATAQFRSEWATATF